MLALAEQLENVSRACKVAGISRSHFYDIKDAFEKYGRDGLAPQPRRRPRMPNQTPPEIEQQILTMTRINLWRDGQDVSTIATRVDRAHGDSVNWVGNCFCVLNLTLTLNGAFLDVASDLIVKASCIGILDLKDDALPRLYLKCPLLGAALR